MKNRPIVSSGLQSFSFVNKETRRKKLENVQNYQFSSTTEHESSKNKKSRQSSTIANNEEVLEETPISVHKLPIKVSSLTALPGSFTDRHSQNRSAYL